MVQVDAPEALHRHGEVALHVLLARHVGRDRDAADLGRHPRGAVPVDVHGDDSGALARQAPGRPSTQASGGAGHHGDLALQTHSAHSPIMIPVAAHPSVSIAWASAGSASANDSTPIPLASSNTSISSSAVAP